MGRRTVGDRLSRITTRTGDDGTTDLGDGSRMAENSLRIAAAGDVDELSSHTGVLLIEALPDDVRTALAVIQHDLFDLDDEPCTPDCTMMTTAHVLRLDQWLAGYNAGLPRLAEFILPGGSHAAAQAHVCRTVAHRAEHSVVALGRAETIGEVPHQYVNRLSDLLFVLAHVFDRADDGTDILWKRDEHKPA